MVFNSYIFILAFFPLVVACSYLLQKLKMKQIWKVFIIITSLLFVLYSDTHSAVFLAFSACVNYILGILLYKWNKNKRIGQILSVAGVILNIGLLAYFKYTYFLVDNLSKYAKIEFQIEEILVPLGISFITFQQIAYLIDIYRGKIVDLQLVNYILYITYFPKLVQGPIVKYNDFILQVDTESKNSVSENMAYGLWLFAQGLAKKVLLADTFAKAVGWGIGISIEHMTALDAVIVVLSFTLQIYFDFSGYSNMAIGISKMLSIDLPDNFDSPYQAKSIIEFWKKWHITLTDFFREYLYFPLGGNRKGKIRAYVNVMIIFIASGFWHGADWTYIIWGFLHGLAYCLNKAFYKQWEKMGEVFRWLLTFIFVNVAWVFFRALSVSQACDILLKIMRMENLSISESLLQCYSLSEVSFLSNRFEGFAAFISQYHGIEMFVFLWIAITVSLNIKDRCVTVFKPTIIKCMGAIIFLSWSIISLSTVVEFIYGGF